MDFTSITGMTVTLQTPPPGSPVSGSPVSITVSADAAGLVAPGEFQVNFTVPEQFSSLPEGEYVVYIRSPLGPVSPSGPNAEIPGYPSRCPPECIVIPIQP